MRRREFIRGLGAVALSPVVARGQPGGERSRRIGLLGVVAPDGYARQIAAFHQGLRDLGWVEGGNIELAARWAEGRYERLPALAAELVGLQPEVIVTSGQGTRALMAATTRTPIVMAVGADAIVDSLARPGGNVTGSTAFSAELTAKRLELLKAAVPRLARVGVLMNPDYRASSTELGAVSRTAAALNLAIAEAPARTPGDFESAFALLVRRRADGLVAFGDSMLTANMRRLGELSAAHRLAGAGSDDYAEGGGLLAYGVNFPELWRRAAYFVDRILKGARPSDLPVERASKFDFVVNRGAARLLGLNVPQSLLVRADRVIE